MAVSNIYRPGALTPSIVLSLGLGLALLVTVIQIDGNLQRQFNAELPDKAPSFFFLDIPSGDSERFDAFLNQLAPAAKLEEVPMLRGRIVAANNVPAEELKPKPDVAWVLQSDRGLSYTEEVPAGSRLVEGEWWGHRLQRPAHRLIREAHRRRPRPQARRLGHGECARPQHHRAHLQPADGRLAKPRHQFRDGVSAERVSRRASHPHGDVDLSGRRHRGAGG